MTGVVRSIRKLEDCLDSAPAKEIEIALPLDEHLMRAMSVDSKLSYYPHFPKPYFRIEKPHSYVIQGVIGNCTFRVTYMPDAVLREEPLLVEILETAGNCGALR